MPMLDAICLTCGKSFRYQNLAHNGKYCSNACRNTGKNRTCKRCGKTFYIKASSTRPGDYCSTACTRTPRITLTCAGCNKPFEVMPNRAETARYCSSNCRPKKIFITRLCITCNKPFEIDKTLEKRFCSISCGVINRLENNDPSGYITSKLQNKTRTGIEQLVETVLIELGIKYEFEKKIGRYLVDFALTEYPVVIEADGWYHTISKARDKTRDEYLAQKGWQVIRILDKDIKQNAHNAVINALQHSKVPQMLELRLP